jgi:hypothetical protein
VHVGEELYYLIVKGDDGFGDGHLFFLPEEKGVVADALDGVGGARIEVVAFKKGSCFG